MMETYRPVRGVRSRLATMVAQKRRTGVKINRWKSIVLVLILCKITGRFSSDPGKFFWSHFLDLRFLRKSKGASDSATLLAVRASSMEPDVCGHQINVHKRSHK